MTVTVSPLPVAAAAGANELAVMVWTSPVVALDDWVKVVTPAILPAAVMPPEFKAKAPEVNVIPVTPLRAPALMLKLLMVLLVAPVMAPLKPNVVTELTAPELITMPLMVLVAVAPVIAPLKPSVDTPLTAPALMLMPLMVPDVAPVIAPLRPRVETPLIAPLLTLIPLMVPDVGATIAWLVLRAPLASKYDCRVGLALEL